jgi:hypothetical protein
VTASQLPDLSGFSAVLTATMALGLLLTQASSARTLASSPKAGRAFKDLRTKTLRVQAELELIERAKAEIAEAMATDDPFPELEQLERIGEKVDTFREAVRNAERAALALDHSLVEALRFDSLYQAAVPEWKAKSRALRQLLVDLREILSAGNLTKGLDRVDEDLARLVKRRMAEEGLADWGASMAPGDEQLLDPSEGTPVAWDSQRGWH